MASHQTCQSIPAFFLVQVALANGLTLLSGFTAFHSETNCLFLLFQILSTRGTVTYAQETLQLLINI